MSCFHPHLTQGSTPGETLGIPNFGSQHKGGPGGARKKSQTSKTQRTDNPQQRNNYY